MDVVNKLLTAIFWITRVNLYADFNSMLKGVVAIIRKWLLNK